MANPNPDTSGLRPFKPGESGNPGGMSKELRAQIDANAAEAVRIRAAALARVGRLIDADGVLNGDLTGEILKLLKDSEDRGLGAPQQTVDVTDRRVSEKPLTPDEWAAKHATD